MSKIIVKQDGLYRDNVKLQLIFGDLEQIEAIKSYIKRSKQFEDGREPFSIEYDIKAKMVFVCLCDDNLFEKTCDADSDGDESCFEWEKFECPSCKRKYEARIKRKDYSIKLFLV